MRRSLALRVVTNPVQRLRSRPSDVAADDPATEERRRRGGALKRRRRGRAPRRPRRRPRRPRRGGPIRCQGAASGACGLKIDNLIISCKILAGSFSAVSNPNFASKYSVESSRRDLHNALFCTVLQSQNLSQKSSTFFRG